jgi:hypothetical protein
MKILLYLAIGMTIGTVSGALGIGGGVLLLPALIWLCAMAPKTAAGTTLAVLVVPVVLPAVLKYHSMKYLDLEAALWIAAAFAVGGYVGAYLSVHHVLPEYTLRLLFGLMMVYVAMRFIFSDSEDAAIVAGIAATVLAWLAYVGVRLVGRRHLGRPSLGENIRAMQQQERADPDYYI